jgi:pimeloyl-ACP methyl ester carboxylesterase
MIPLIDFGGSGPLLHFAHANGYPPRAYTPLLQTLTPRYHVLSMLARPLWPASTPNGMRDWSVLVDDLIRFLDERGAQGILGVGHSMGGVSTLQATLRRPDLFRAIVLIDPVIFSPGRLWLWRIVKASGFGRRLHPLIRSTEQRRREFASLDEMFTRYRRAPVFSRMTDDSLRAYVNSISQARPDGTVELSYPPEWEARVYYSGPPDLWGQVDQLKTPLLLIYGAESNALQTPSVRRMRRLVPHAEYRAVEGAGHLVPLEKPHEVSRLILDFLERST